MNRDEADTRPVVGRSDTQRCPACGRHVYADGNVFCSMKCKVRADQEAKGNFKNELEVLMRQFREGNWTEVDGCNRYSTCSSVGSSGTNGKKRSTQRRSTSSNSAGGRRKSAKGAGRRGRK